MERFAVLIPGDQEALERVLQECTTQNGGILVGNPTVQQNLTGITLKDEDEEEGSVITVVIIEDEADRGGWWREFARVHGWKLRQSSESN